MDRFIAPIHKLAADSVMWMYRHIYIPYRVYIIRHKSIIKVGFEITSLGVWKTETLFRMMQEHPRFNPLVIVARNKLENVADERNSIEEYCKKKGYDYVVIGKDLEHASKGLGFDIFFYQRPYVSRTDLSKNLKPLFCYVTYGFRGTLGRWAYDRPLLKNAWQIYYENESNKRVYTELLGTDIDNGYSTGIPIMDELMTTKEQLKDSWKGSSDKKRIIYAPHHSINPNDVFHSSTFLETGEMMLRIAEKYSDKVQWLFKPHPVLKNKLYEIWGKEKTDEYYKRWSEAEWSQFENGKYLEFFTYSDAMIHDCGSFTIEYLYTCNPVMYLLHDKESLAKDWNEMQTKALDVHIHGCSENDIEEFIENVVSDNDVNKRQRTIFYNKYLIPPFGKSACQNIIDCILNPKAAKRMRVLK